MPAKAGIQNCLKTLDSRLRVNDVKVRLKIFSKPQNLTIKGPRPQASHFIEN